MYMHFPQKNVDTSNLNSVKNIIKRQKSTDILILNSGGPPRFSKTTDDDWLKYFNQLFFGVLYTQRSKN